MSEEDISVTIISDESSIDEDEEEPSISSMEEKRVRRAKTQRMSKLKRAKTRSVRRQTIEVDIEPACPQVGQKQELTRMEKLRNMFPKQPMYAWSTMNAVCGTIFGIISFIMPWLEGTTTCITTGEFAPKLDNKVFAYQVFETRLLVPGQIILALLFLLMITKTAALPNDYKSKTPTTMRFLFIIYVAAVYLVYNSTAEINKELTNHAEEEYAEWPEADPDCPQDKFVIKATFTLWQQLFRTSIILTLTACVTTIFRTIFVSQTARLC